MEVGLAMALIIIFCSIDKVFEKLHILWHQPDGKYEPHYPPSGSGIEYLDTMDIPHSGYSAEQRHAEYMRRGQSPSGFINGIYNDQNRPRNVPYYDGNRDWGADDQGETIHNYLWVEIYPDGRNLPDMITTMEIFNDTDVHSGFTIAWARCEEVKE